MTIAGDGADRKLLLELLEHETLRPTERDAFAEMLTWLDGRPRRRLSDKQRAWAQRKLDALRPKYENLYSAGKVPRGREVAVNCGPLPLRPPSRGAA